MITSLRVSNYRSLGPRIELRPGRLSVLIGPNGSGKSNVLDVLSFLRDAMMLGLSAAVIHRGGIGSVRRRSTGRPFDVSIELEFELADSTASYRFVLTGDRQEEYKVKSESADIFVAGKRAAYFIRGEKWSSSENIVPRMDDQSLALNILGGLKTFKPLVDFLSSMMVYAIFPDTLRLPQKFDPALSMKAHGENWVSILRDLVKRTADKRELIVGLQKLTGDILDVRVKSASQHLIAEFRQEHRAKKVKAWFDAAGESDGTLRVAGLLTALLQTPPLPVIGVEEPELTVHPGALPMLMDYLRQASEVSQVFITTHNPILLDRVEIDRDPVFMVTRSAGETRVDRVSEHQLDPVRRNLLSLGELFVAGGIQGAFPFDDGIIPE